MNVYLMRHAHAVERAEWSGPDATRPLTGKGRAAAVAVADGLAREAPPVSRIISSPYARALETATVVAQRLGLPVTEDARLGPGFDAPRLTDVVGEARAADSLLLVGHEPDLGAIVTGLAGDWRQHVIFKKAAVALLQLPAVTSKNTSPGWHNLSEIVAGAALVWLRPWREWERLANE